MATYKSIAYDQILGNPSAMVLLQEQTVSSAVSTLSFTSGIDSTYKTYFFQLIDLWETLLFHQLQMLRK